MTSSVLPPFSSKVTVVTGPPSPASSFVQTRRECGVTSMYLPKNAIGFEASLPHTNICLAGNHGHVNRLWYPPLLEQLGLGPRLEHDARRGVEGSRDDELTLGLPFRRRAVLDGVGLTLSSCVHRPSPSVSVPRQPCPARRSARPRAGGTPRSMPFLSPVGAG